MITLEEFKKEKIAINTRTQEKYSNLMKLFDSKDKLWCGVKSLSNQTFDYSRENTCILCTIHRISCGGKNYALGYDSKSYCEKEGYKIITPNQLKEYNKFMEKPKYITTHAELLKLHGRSITCKINGIYVDDAKICVENKNKRTLICQNLKAGADSIEDFGYDYVWWISSDKRRYEKNDNIDCTEIKLKEETQYLTIGQAIDYMLESEDNEIEYYDTYNKVNCKTRIESKSDYPFIEYNYEEDDQGTKNVFNKCINIPIEVFSNWKNIKKHIEPVEPKQKTLKEKLQAKEPFIYKNTEYKFNTNGVILEPKGGAMSLDKIKELLKQCEE